MKKIFIPLILCISTTLSAQYQIGLIPRTSPDKSISEQVGYTKITITYGSPRTKGRDVFGDLVPYDKVWRAGANNATTISFSDDVWINGEALAAGEYSFFIIPKEKEYWTIIFNSNSTQWGAFRYEDTTDVLRLSVRPTMNTHTEALTYTLDAVNTEQTSLFVDWAQIRLVLNIKVNNLKGISALVEERASKQTINTSWVVYIQGADYLVNQDQHIDQALQWLNKSEQLYHGIQKWHEEFYPKERVLTHLYWVKAQALALQGKYADAKLYVKKMKELGKLADQFLDEELITSW